MCDSIGIDEAVARKAVGAVLEFVQKNVPEDFDWTEVLSKLPGAQDLIKQATDAGASSAPRAGGDEGGPKGGTSLIAHVLRLITNPSITSIIELIKKILSPFLPASVMGMIESAGDGAELVGFMNKLGVTTEQGKSIVTMLITFMKGKLGDEVVDKMVDQIPAVKSVLESTKKDE